MTYRIVEDFSGMGDAVAYANEIGIIELANKVESGDTMATDVASAIKRLNNNGYTVEETGIEWTENYIVVEER